MKYKKIPVVVEARKLELPELPQNIASWCGGYVGGSSDVGEFTWIEIPTLEGIMRANYGDYIIKGVKGEFYPCKPDIFELTYEKVA